MMDQELTDQELLNSYIYFSCIVAADLPVTPKKIQLAALKFHNESVSLSLFLDAELVLHVILCHYYRVMVHCALIM